MRNEYELVNHDDHLAVRVFLHDAVRSPRHWHEDIEILFVIKGSIKVILGAEEIVVPAKGLCVVNSYQVHHVEAIEDNLTLALQIEPDYIDERSPGFKSLRFAPVPFDGRPTSESDELRRAIAEIMSAVSRKGRGYLSLANQWLFRVAFLLESACVDPGLRPTVIVAEEVRLRRITDFIEDNAGEEIKLGDLASFANLNAQYLSRYFSNHMGVTLSKYIASIRARNALELLETSSKAITDIALECGFPNLKAFYAAFKENFGKMPKDYRAAAPRRAGAPSGALSGSGGGSGDRAVNVFDYLQIDTTAGLATLYEYLDTAASSRAPSRSERRTIALDAGEGLGPVPRDATRMAAFGRAAEGLRAEWRDQFRMLQREIGFDMVRFHGILNDEMLVAARGADGSLRFDFGYVDELLDFLLANGARPFLGLDFMPTALASADRTIFRWKGNVSPPSDLAEWRSLVAAFVEHLGARYGRRELRSWRFEVWNEPDLEGVFWSGSRGEFFEFFAATLKELKSFDPGLSVGGCGFTQWSLLNSDWLDGFESSCVSRGIMPDFVSYHVYPLDIVSDSFDVTAFVDEWIGRLSIPDSRFSLRMGGPDAVIETMRLVGERLDRGPFASLPRYVTEWNSSPNSRDLVHDSAFMGAFVAHNLASCAGLSAGMAWWVFTDIFDEFGPGDGEFHGGFGLCTKHGVRKASWHAMRMHSRLEGELLGRGDGWLAAKGADGVVRLLLYNYRHYDAAYTRLDASRLSRLNRYDVFEPGDDIEFVIDIAGLDGERALRVSRIGRAAGSAFDRWMEMGHPDDLRGEDLLALRHASEPTLRIERLDASRGLRLSERLEAHDVELVEILPA